jgi:hypothetical protein
LKAFAFLLILGALLIPSVAVGGVVQTFDAPDTGITGLGYGSGSLWAVDGTTHYCYEIDPADGSVLSSFYVDAQGSGSHPTGMAFFNSQLHIVMNLGSSYGYVYRYSTSGSYQSMYSVYC